MATFAIVRSVFVVVLGVWLLCETVTLADHSFVFDDLIYSAVAIISAIVYAIIIFRDYKEFRKTKSGTSYVATICGCILIACLFIADYLLAKRDNSPTILFAITPSDFNGVSIDLRADSTYKITSWCMGADIYRGKFQMKDSTIILDENNFDASTAIRSNRLKIHWKDSLISQTDSFGSAYDEGFSIRKLK